MRLSVLLGPAYLDVVFDHADALNSPHSLLRHLLLKERLDIALQHNAPIVLGLEADMGVGKVRTRFDGGGDSVQ